MRAQTFTASAKGTAGRAAGSLVMASRGAIVTPPAEKQMEMLTLMTWLVLAEPKVTVSQVPCETELDCWLDESGQPIARPKKAAGKPLPRGDCGKNLRWLRNELSCEKKVCVARLVGDRC